MFINNKKTNFPQKQFCHRNKNLKKLGFANYKEYLKSDYWKKIKERWNCLRKSKKYWNMCYVCDGQKNLILHHLNYSITTLLKFVGSHMLPVCNDCHNKIHTLEHNEGIGIRQATKRCRREYSKNKIQ
jgi:hypothetical protein